MIPVTYERYSEPHGVQRAIEPLPLHYHVLLAVDWVGSFSMANEPCTDGLDDMFLTWVLNPSSPLDFDSVMTIKTLRQLRRRILSRRRYLLERRAIGKFMRPGGNEEFGLLWANMETVVAQVDSLAVVREVFDNLPKRRVYCGTIPGIIVSNNCNGLPDTYEIYYNLFARDPYFLPSHRTDATVGLARRLFLDPSCGVRPILADALEDAGYPHDEADRFRMPLFPWSTRTNPTVLNLLGLSLSDSP